MLDLACNNITNLLLAKVSGVEVGESLPDFDRAYYELKPLFWGALGKLARQGFVTPPADGQDLIHDFFADEWANVQRTFDPAKGDYRIYAYRAFVQFVRPRIVRMQRLQNYRIRPEEAEIVMSQLQATTEDPEAAHDGEVLKRRIDDLPELHRNVLQEYLYGDNTSERALAKEFSLSRYKARELLVDALGRIMVTLDKPKKISAEDWQIALALWKDARSIEDTARYLGITEHQVKTANKRNFVFLTTVLNIYRPPGGGGIGRKSQMKTGAMLEPRALFKNAVFSPGDEELLRQVEKRAAEVTASLDSADAIDISDEELHDIDQLWLARLYEALAKVDAIEDELETPPLVDPEASVEYEIGRAYRDSLVEGLPADLRDLGQWLSHLPKIDKYERADLAQSPSVLGAMPLSNNLVQYGVTPLMVLEGTDAVSRLIERCLRTGRLSRTQPTRLSPAGLDDGELITGEMLAREISLISTCPEPAAPILLEWSIRVAHFKPQIFNGFVAEPYRRETEVTVRACEWKANDLDVRWGISQLKEAIASH